MFYRMILINIEWIYWNLDVYINLELNCQGESFKFSDPSTNFFLQSHDDKIYYAKNLNFIVV
jgi:hypothetical protein